MAKCGHGLFGTRTRGLLARMGRDALTAAMLLLAAAGNARAQVAFQRTAEAGSGATGITVTIPSFDPSSASDLLLVVGLSFGGGVAPTGVSVTYGGVALTLVPGTSGTSSDNLQHTELWYLVNPSITPGNIVASWTGTRGYAMGAVSFSGVHQTTPVLNGTYATGNSTTTSVTITSAAGDMTMDTVSQNSGAATPLSAPTQTQRWLDAAPTNVTAGGSTAPGVATVTHAWTNGSSVPWVSSGVDIKAAAIIAPRSGYKVGSFTKSVGVAPATQVIAHGLGQTPKALILWTDGNTGSAVTAGYDFAIGFTDGTTSGSAASASRDAVATAATARRNANKVLTIVNGSQTLLAEATFSSWDGTNFTLSWNPNDANAYVIHYIAIGGSDVSAQVLNWQMPTATGNKKVTGFTFEPTATIHIHSGSGATAAPPSTTTTSAVGIGVMDFAGNQWSSATFSTSSNPSDTQRLQLDNVAFVSGGTSITKQATFVSMNADGFTMNFSTANASAGQVFTLALAGVNVQAGSFLKNTSAAAPAATFVQQAARSTTATTVTQTFPLVSTAKNLIVVSLNVGSATANVLSVSDSKGNTYTRAAGPTLWSAASSRVSTYYASNITGGGAATTVTATLDASAFVEMYQLEYSGVLPMSPLDQVSVGTGTVAAMDSGSKTTTYLNELIYGFGMSCGSATIGGTFTARSTFDSNFVGDRGVVALGTYNVNGTDACGSWAVQMLTFKVGRSQSITGLGFMPSAVLFKSFQDVPNAAGEVQSRQGIGASDGTTEGSSAYVEQNAVTPSVVKSIDKTTKAFMKVNNNTANVEAEADLTSMDPDGFSLAWTTNDAAGTEIFYLAIAPLAVTEVRLISATATTYDRGVLLQWRTGYEFDNLGFNLYRDVDGVRTKVNASLVAGSGLLAARGTTVTSAHSYARWDLDAPRSGAVTYWLEDLDFNGKRTLYGPIVPVAGGRQAPDVQTSGDVKDLGKQTQNPNVRLRQDEDLSRGVPKPWTAQSPSQIDTQWMLAGQAAVKIGVTTPGWYRVTQPTLMAAGLDPHSDPHLLRLFVDGVEQAIRVTGEADGQFDPADSVEFYGSGVDTPYTATRVYWLIVGAQPGLRINLTGVAGNVATAASPSFWSTLERKDRRIFFAALKNGDSENWFGPVVSSDPTDLTMTAANVDWSVPDAAQLTVVLQGVTNASDGSAGHVVGVLINGVEVGQADFQGQVNSEQTFPVPLSALVDGENTVTLVARGGDVDLSLVDSLRLSYWHTLVADADMLRFTIDQDGPIAISGFTSAALHVVDITDPAAATELLGTIRPDPGGTVSIAVRVTGGWGTRTLLAFSDATVATPAFVEANQPSSWHAATNAHDYVIISHGDFVPDVLPLVERRASEGHTPAVIDVQDIYDEFSYGEKTPQALRDFLQWATTTWHQAPKFVVLVGDATMDPRDYAGLGDADFVPTKEVPMTLVALETPSDDWFVDFNDDGLPEIAVGRLSVATPAQAAAMVAKIAGYNQAGVQAWAKDVLLVADTNDATSDFEQYSRNLAGLLPSDYRPHQVFKGTLGDDGAHQAIIDGVNAGQLLVNFIGHGSVGIWGSHGELLTNDDIAATWHDATRLPFVVAMNCLNGLFDSIYDEESLAEALMRAPNAGAVATWASSSVTSSATQSLVNAELFRLIFGGASATLGEAVGAAKRVVSSSDLRRSWIFFGDPAMQLMDTPQPVVSPSTPVAPATTGSTPAAGQTVHATLPGDFDGDGSADLAVFRPSTGAWYIRGASVSFTWGGGADMPVAGDYDGDGRIDLAVFRPSTGTWYIWQSRTQTGLAYTWGNAGDIPAPGDYDGDGQTDIAVFRPATGAWYIWQSRTQTGAAYTWGGAGDIPILKRP